MNHNKFTFQSQNLHVDYLTFKFPELDHKTQMKIVNYLSKLHFNSYQESGKFSKPIRQEIFIDPKNQHEAFFVVDNSYWNGTLLHFSGSNAGRFYFIAKHNVIDWTIFSTAILSRFDLYFQRHNTSTDRIPPKEFLENCFRELKETNKNVRLEKNKKGILLKVGSRKSNHYSRIYEGENFLRFEYEMKGQFLKKYHLLLIENRFDQFEQKLSYQFVFYLGKLLPLQFSYLDWLVLKLRPIKKQNILPSHLKLDYIRKMNIKLNTNPKNFFTLLQFLVYAHNLPYQMDSLGSTYYRKVSFRIQDFLRYKQESNNYYQIKKLLIFFDELQTNSLIKFFSDNHYRSLVTISEVNLTKDQHKFWVAEVWIAEELFNYTHPFSFPDLVKQKLTKPQLQVYFKFIQVFSSVNIEKIFDIKDFLQSYSSALSNQEKTKLKKYFIQLIELFQEHELIESNYKIISDGKICHIDKLTPKNISEGFVIYERISI